MPRIRYLKPEFFKDEDLAAFPFDTRLFYAGLWCLADKAGRLEDRVLRLKAEIFPYDSVDAEKCLQQLSQVKLSSQRPFINRYEYDNQWYIQIVNWEKHQKPHHTEKESKIPPPPPLKIKGMEKGMENQLEASTELRNGEVTVKEPLKGRFTPPSFEEIIEYTKEINFQLDAQQFIDFYQAKGWMIGKNKMKDWKAAVRTWRRRTEVAQAGKPKKLSSEEITKIINREYEKKEAEEKERANAKLRIS